MTQFPIDNQWCCTTNAFVLRSVNACFANALLMLTLKSAPSHTDYGNDLVICSKQICKRDRTYMRTTYTTRSDQGCKNTCGIFCSYFIKNVMSNCYLHYIFNCTVFALCVFPIDLHATDFTISAKFLFAEQYPFVEVAFAYLTFRMHILLTFYPSNTESEIRYRAIAVLLLLLPYI